MKRAGHSQSAMIHDGQLLRRYVRDGDEPSFRELAPILLDGIPNGEQQDAALSGLLALGPSGREFALHLAEMLHDAIQPGRFRLRERLIEVLAEVDPESRHQWPEVDRHMTEKAPVNPSAPKPLFARGDLLPALQALSEVATCWQSSELGCPSAHQGTRFNPCTLSKCVSRLASV